MEDRAEEKAPNPNNRDKEFVLGLGSVVALLASIVCLTSVLRS
jgi:hypothetical protein